MIGCTEKRRNCDGDHELLHAFWGDDIAFGVVNPVYDLQHLTKIPMKAGGKDNEHPEKGYNVNEKAS